MFTLHCDVIARSAATKQSIFAAAGCFASLAMTAYCLPETISSTSRNCSLPKNISLPTKKVGEPNAPRSTADLRVLDQLRLDVRLLRAREQLCGVEAGRGQCLHRHFGIVHFLRLDPHVMKRGVDIFLEHAFELCGDRRAHQIQRVDRERTDSRCRA